MPMLPTTTGAEKCRHDARWVESRPRSGLAYERQEPGMRDHDEQRVPEARLRRLQYRLRLRRPSLRVIRHPGDRDEHQAHE